MLMIFKEIEKKIKKMPHRRRVAFILALIMVTAGVVHPGTFSSKTFASSVSELQDQQKETQEKIESIEDKRQDAREDLDELDEEAERLDESLSGLKVQMSNIDAKISAANSDIETTEKNISDIEARIDEVQKLQKLRHEMMKRHIVFFYENKSQMDLFELLFTSSSFPEFLNRTEMLSAIIEYDRGMIADYEAAEQELLDEENDLEIAKAKLSSKKKELKSSQKEMDKLVASVQSDVDANAREREQTAEELAAYEKKLRDLAKKMKSLEESVALAQIEEAKRLAEAMAAAAEAGEVEDTTGAYAASASDVTLLAATIQAEAGNQSTYGQQAVASVIMNRVKSSLFPNTIYGVITQENQFASYRSGMVDAYIEQGPDEGCVAVAQAAIDGERVGNWLFFMTVPYADKYGITGYEVIGDHAFFYRWGAN